MSDILTGAWLVVGGLRLLVLFGKLPAAGVQKRLKIIGPAIALVLLGTVRFWFLLIEGLYVFIMSSIARPMTSPRFVDWGLTKGKR